MNLLQRAADDVRRQSGSSRNLEQLNRVWDELPPSMRKDEQVIRAYAEHLASLGAEAQAETLLRKVLRNHWSDPLINLYGRIKGGDSRGTAGHGRTLAAGAPEQRRAVTGSGSSEPAQRTLGQGPGIPGTQPAPAP